MQNCTDKTKHPIKVMFVCHGNICRSPMAEYVFRDLAEKAGRGAEFYVRSSAVSAEEIWGEIGNPIYPPVKKILNGLGIECDEKRAEQLTVKHGEEYDYIFCMDLSNVRKAKQIVGSRYENKVVRLLDFVGIGGDVADPWYTRDFHATYLDVLNSSTRLLKLL